ncbi:MAG: histone deacetylase, partial [Deltaproteobacteria bacterium]|nr:histone deacetylase [Deltaproteobacteria bacterium]
MSRHNVAVLHDPLFEDHDPGDWHPERPARLPAILARLVESNLLQQMELVRHRAASRAELELVHLPALVEQILSLRHRHAAIDPDTAVSPGSVEAAEHAAGGSMELVDWVLAGEKRRGLGLVRPPGHHATARRSMGFCLFNNIAVAAAHALKVHGLERILVVDWDVHHGNGTQDIFYEDPRVLYFSVHQYPFYP